MPCHALCVPGEPPLQVQGEASQLIFHSQVKYGIQVTYSRSCLKENGEKCSGAQEVLNPPNLLNCLRVSSEYTFLLPILRRQKTSFFGDTVSYPHLLGPDEVLIPDFYLNLFSKIWSVNLSIL